MSDDSRKTLGDIKMKREAAMLHSFSMPWQYSDATVEQLDEDGFSIGTGELTQKSLSDLQEACWSKYYTNPHVNSSIRDEVGRLVGSGFLVSSDDYRIQDVIEETIEDWRNRLEIMLPKYITRSRVEGELFLVFTVHDDGFIEIDFRDPASLETTKGSKGIIFHPNKPNMPLIYCFSGEDGHGEKIKDQIPSIFVARSPKLIKQAAKHNDYNAKRLENHKKTGKKYAKLGNFRRFVVSWDMGLLTSRNISHLRTTLEWINHYENLKKYEIDHKKSSGAYAWVFKFTEWSHYMRWLDLTESERRKTGVGQKITPGDRLILPPGMEADVKNPNLTKISDQDTDIMSMITSGLNQSEDQLTGSYRSSFASAKVSQGPQVDRMEDAKAELERFLRIDFWGSVFFLRAAVTDFPEMFTIKEPIDFKKKKTKDEKGDDEYEVKYRNKKVRPERLIKFDFPSSSFDDSEGRAKALLGVKHGSLNRQLGIPNENIAGRLGFGGSYKRMRLLSAAEEDKYPKLGYEVDQEVVQEKQTGEEKIAKKSTPGSKSEKDE